MGSPMPEVRCRRLFNLETTEGMHAMRSKTERITCDYCGRCKAGSSYSALWGNLRAIGWRKGPHVQGRQTHFCYAPECKEKLEHVQAAVERRGK